MIPISVLVKPNDDDFGSDDERRHKHDDDFGGDVPMYIAGKDGGGKKKKDNNSGGNNSTQQSYFPAPKNLPGFPDAGNGVYNKESGRKRWKLPDGSILEWDYQHGRVEKYDKSGKNQQGEYDP